MTPCAKEVDIMKKTKQNTESVYTNQIMKEFGEIISSLKSGLEGVMETITGSFESTRKESEEITALFADSRSEAEMIFSIFSGIASLFSGGGGIIDSFLGFLPGGDLISTLLGGSAPHLPAAHSNMYPPAANYPSATTVIVNTQLERAGLYRVYREGKLISELRPTK